MSERTSASLHRWALSTVALTLLLIVAGGLVTSRDAGLAVPDWPLSFGSVNPPRWYAIDNVRTEHGHRLIAGLVAITTVLLGLRVRRLETRPAVRRLAAAAVATVLLQATLGGLRVLQLSVDLAMVHAWLGQMFLCLVVSLAVVTSPEWPRSAAASLPERLPAHALVTVSFVVVQLVIGIWIRHLGESARPLLGNAVFYAHAASALAIVWAAMRLERTASTGAGASGFLVRLTRTIVGLVVVQMLLGLGALLVTETMAYDRQASLLESWIPTLHVTVGAAILSTTVAAALHALAPRTAMRASMRPSAGAHFAQAG